MKKYTITILVLLIATYSAFCFNPDEKEFKPSIKPYLNLQVWNIYSSGNMKNGEEVQNRFVSYFRRGRFGAKGYFAPTISFNAQFYFDYLAKDADVASKGTPNASTIGVWSANIIWKVFENSEFLYLTGGTFLPQISRESVTTPWSVSSLDKAETSCYLRQFITGKTNGICPGVNAGGLINIASRFQMVYNVAVVNRQDKTSIMVNNWSPVVLGRVEFVLGDPENNGYKYGISPVPDNKNKNLILGLGSSGQGETDAFKKSSTLGADLSMSYNFFKIESSYFKLFRKNISDYQGNNFCFKMSSAITIQNKWIFQPAFMFDWFKGDAGYSDAMFFDGTDRLFDFGINAWNPSQKIKIGLHYLNHSGNGTSNHFISSGAKPGDYCCLSVQLQI